LTDEQQGQQHATAHRTASRWGHRLTGIIAMVPWYFRGVEGKGMPLEATVG
jgi:hypothetical protein